VQHGFCFNVLIGIIVAFSLAFAQYIGHVPVRHGGSSFNSIQFNTFTSVKPSELLPNNHCRHRLITLPGMLAACRLLCLSSTCFSHMVAGTM
jgi:hypothetical protein